MNILLVDDDQILANIFKLTLKNHTLDHFSNIEDSINSIISKKYDSIIIDLHLPGCSGICILKKIKELAIDIKNIIVLTGLSDYSIMKVCLEYGANRFLTKDKDTLINIEKYIL